MENVIVAKVGGSLFDHPALGPGLKCWTKELGDSRLLLVSGGGLAAEAVRQYHRVHMLPEEFSHWLAIRMMDVNGELLRHFLSEPTQAIDVYEFCQKDEGQALALPHTWRVTSDSIAARIAESLHARELVLLKSIDLPIGIDWHRAAELGLVDPMFGEIVERALLMVKWINFRRGLDGFLNSGQTINSGQWVVGSG